MCAAVARRYEEPDTVVVSVEEDEMQVLLLDSDGEERWHRLAHGEPSDHTACGRPYDFRLDQLGQRLSRYDGQLCKGGPHGCCFTPFELARAAKNKDRRPWEGAREDTDR